MQERKELSLQDCESEITEAPKVPVEKNTKSTRAKSMTKAAVVIDIIMIAFIVWLISIMSDLRGGYALGVALAAGFLGVFGLGICAWLQLLVMFFMICALCDKNKTKALIVADIVLLIIALFFVALPSVLDVIDGTKLATETWLIPLRILGNLGNLR